MAKLSNKKFVTPGSVLPVLSLFDKNDNDGGGGMVDGCNIYLMPDQITVMLITHWDTTSPVSRD